MSTIKYWKPVGYLLITFSLVSGCASAPKTHIPKGIVPIPEGKARIIVTRPHLITLAIPPLIVIDIGENIDPNGLIVARNGPPPFISDRGSPRDLDFRDIDTTYTALAFFGIIHMNQSIYSVVKKEVSTDRLTRSIRMDLLRDHWAFFGIPVLIKDLMV